MWAMAKFFLTGATGFLGGHVLAQALRAGHDVAVLVRDVAKLAPEYANHPKLVVHLGDVLDPDSLRCALKTPVDALFHIAASTNTWARHNIAQTQVNVAGIENLLAAAKGKVGRFIDTSTVAVYGLTKRVIDENSPHLGLHSWINYARTKAIAQTRVQGSGLDTVVLNPTHLLGPCDRHNWARLFQMIDAQRLPGAPPGSGSFADVRSVAAAHLRAFDVGRCGESYLLGGAQASFLTLVQLIAGELGRSAPKRATPALFIAMLARAKVSIAAISGVEPDMTPESAAFVCHHMQCDIAKAQLALGLHVTPLPQLVADTVKWMRADGMLRRT
jgi:dihydroflavonol-4-reductase